MCVSFVNSIHCLVPCVQGLSCPGFVVSRVCRVQGLSCPGFVCPGFVCPGFVCPGFVCPGFVRVPNYRPCANHESPKGGGMLEIYPFEIKYSNVYACRTRVGLQESFKNY
jgi:hypothetical protein